MAYLGKTQLPPGHPLSGTKIHIGGSLLEHFKKLRRGEESEYIGGKVVDTNDSSESKAEGDGKDADQGAKE